MIQSFDIFDTCLTRKVAEPAGVFDKMAERLALRPSFRFDREEAEREATRRHGDATLEEIYAVLGEWRNWDEETRRAMMSAELDEETSQLVAVPEMLEKVREFRRKGGAVAYLSDMYLPSAFLRERMRDHGFYEEGDLLMVSCEQRKSKANGSLFREAAARLETTRWEHIGNHLKADVTSAEKAGLAGIHFTRANPTAHETRLIGWSRSGANLGVEWAGASRQARIRLGALTEPEHSIASVAAGVAGPLLLAYATWLVDRASHHGLDTLYFLARDGQILRELFVRIAEARGEQIDARYLFASRIALRFPREFPMSDEEAAGVFQAGVPLPVSVVALRLGLPVEELRSHLPEDCARSGFVRKNQVAACREALARPEVCRRLQEVSVARRAALSEYLNQEGLAGRSRIGLVDLGWGGSLQAGIQNTLREMGHSPDVYGFYLGLKALHPDIAQAEAFTFDFRKGPAKDVPWFVTMAELFSQANHGSTLGFRRNSEGTMIPVLDEPDGENPRVPDWLRIHQNTILYFADGVIARDALPECPEALGRLLRDHLREFCFRPSRSEAEAWGSCHFSSHGCASIREEIAPPPRTPVDIAWICGIRCLGVGAAIWPHGSAARLPRPFDRSARIFHRIMSRLRPLKW